ncbi:MAG: hypothetical protein OEM78_16125, partial [Gammaproteobacteria bacterium]|nr:hypothetical protein [Gammaproteobacteria bacterium]
MTAAELANAVKSRFAAWLGFGLGVFHLANVAGLLVVSTMVVRAVHLTVVLVLIYFSFAAFTEQEKAARMRIAPYIDLV